MSQLDDYKYVVSLAPNKTGFYDPVSRCNLFKTRQVFGFNIEPTKNILSAVKSGTLVDVKGNINTKPTDMVRIDPSQLAQLQGAAPLQEVQLQPGVPPNANPILPPLFSVGQDAQTMSPDANSDPNASSASTPAGGEDKTKGGSKGKSGNKPVESNT